MEHVDSQTGENVAPKPQDDPTRPQDGPGDVLPLQQGSLPDGGDFSSSEPVGGSKPDPISRGPNVKDTIAGRN